MAAAGSVFFFLPVIVRLQKDPPLHVDLFNAYMDILFTTKNQVTAILCNQSNLPGLLCCLSVMVSKFL